MSPIIDISPPVSSQIAVWPGDVPYRRDVNLSLAGGDNIELGSVETTLHLGAHADAPSHYSAGAPSIADRPLEPYLGPAEVVQVSAPRGSRIRPAHLPGPPRARRVLLRTDSYPDPRRFNEDFNGLSSELVSWLAAAGVVLVGIDTPSVDPFADRALESHHELARHDMANLEGLVLGHVVPDLYTLIALPLRLEDGDASPVRAVLVSHDEDGGGRS